MPGLVTWTTDVPASSQVEYGTTSALGLATPYDPIRGTAHAVQLTGLIPGQQYFYRVRGRNTMGTEFVSSIQSFTQPGSLISHGLITWTTSAASTTQVEYGTTSAYGTLTPIIDTNVPVTNHRYQLLGLTPGALYHYRVRSRLPSGTESISSDATFTYGSGYIDNILADSPVAYYRLGEPSGTSAADTSGNGNTGTYTNGVVLGTAGAQTSDADTAVTFDGSNDRIDIPHSQEFNLFDDLSLEAWVYPTARVTVGMLVTKDTGNGAANNTFEWRLETTGIPSFRQFTDALRIVFATVAAPLNQWSLIAVTKTGTTIQHYLNGVANGSGTITGIPSNNSLPLRIGARDDLTAFYAGRLDEVAIYPSALSAGRLQAHYTVSGNATLIAANDTGALLSSESTQSLLGFFPTDATTVLSSESFSELATSARADTAAVLSAESQSSLASLPASNSAPLLSAETAGATQGPSAAESAAILSAETAQPITDQTVASDTGALLSAETFVPIAGTSSLTGTDATLILSTEAYVLRLSPSVGDSTMVVGADAATLLALFVLSNTGPMVGADSAAVGVGLVLTTTDATTLVSAGAASAVLSDPPVISAIVVSRLSDTSVLITWTTDKPSTSQVEFGTSIVYGQLSPLDSNVNTAHSVTLVGLLPSTTYFFRVRSDG